MLLRETLARTLLPTASLLAAHLAVKAAIDERAVEPSGLDPTTCDLLLRIAMSPDGQLRAVDLCNQLKLSPSHVSRRLDRAVDDGLITRSPDPADRRAHVIALTDTGRAALDRFTPLLTDVTSAVVDETLTPAEVVTLTELLGRIESAANTLRARTPDHQETNNGSPPPDTRTN